MREPFMQLADKVHVLSGTWINKENSSREIYGCIPLSRKERYFFFYKFIHSEESLDRSHRSRVNDKAISIF